MSSGTIEGSPLCKESINSWSKRKGQKALSISERRAVTIEWPASKEVSEIVGKQAADREPSRSARPRHRGLSDAITYRTGEVEHKFVRSTQSRHRGLSDAGIGPIEGPVEVRPVHHLDLIVQCLQSRF